LNRRHVGDHLRHWRQRRRLTQLDLACEAGISGRHLSFVETGRSKPSREMILHLAEQLQIPMRERNMLLIAGGYAPIFPERGFSDSALSAVREAIGLLLESHKPYPAFALDRHWNLVTSNRALPILYEGVSPALVTPPVNAMRLSLHPEGLAPRILNLSEWRAYAFRRLRRAINLTADPVLVELLREIQSFPEAASPAEPAEDQVIVPFRVRTSVGVLSFFTTIMVFGTPIDVSLSELALESFLPADEETAEIVARLPPT
jgi:transcriptional regulator with XRE-family HTH domain